MVHQIGTEENRYSLPSSEDGEDIYQGLSKSDIDIFRFKCLSLERFDSNCPHFFDFPRRSAIDTQELIDYPPAFEENSESDLVMSQSQIHCVVILGELSVGKSALCRKFFHTGIPGHGTCDYDDVFSCHGVTGKNSDGQGKNHHIYERPVVIGQRSCQLKILDINTEKHLLESSDDELYSDLGPIVDVSEACIVTYAVTDKGTFKTAEEILTKLFENSELRMRTRPVILVGNKCDLVRKRQVSTNDGAKLADSFSVKFIETSATLNQNVSELFEGVIQQIRLRAGQSSRRSSATQRTNIRPSLIKRLSQSILNPFGVKRLDKNDGIDDSDNQSTTSVSSDSSTTRNSKGKTLSLWKSKKGKCSNGFGLCQDLSVL